jgi:hypothetical protein
VINGLDAAAFITALGTVAATFITALGTVAERADIRKSQSEQADATSHEASLGKLKDEMKWVTWCAGFKNYLSTQLGSLGVPLSYVI